MSTKGWNSLKPITTPDQTTAPIHWNPMNEDWKMWAYQKPDLQHLFWFRYSNARCYEEAA